MTGKNQTDNSISEARWRSKVIKTKPLVARYDSAIKQAKVALKTKGFAVDLATAILRLGKLEKRMKYGLTVRQWQEVTILRKQVKLATLLAELGQ